MNINDVNKVMEKYWLPKMKGFIFNKRLCRECAREEWKDIKGNPTVYERIGVCENCKKTTLVAYLQSLDKGDTDENR